MNAASSKVFVGLNSLRRSNISSTLIPVEDFQNTHIFDELPSLRYLAVVHEVVCCVSNIQCIADLKNNDIFFSCSNIIQSSVILYILQIAVFTITLLNSVSFIWQIRHASGLKCVFMCGSSLSDSFIALYVLIIICSHYIHYGNVAFVA